MTDWGFFECGLGGHGNSWSAKAPANAYLYCTSYCFALPNPAILPGRGGAASSTRLLRGPRGPFPGHARTATIRLGEHEGAAGEAEAGRRAEGQTGIPAQARPGRGQTDSIAVARTGTPLGPRIVPGNMGSWAVRRVHSHSRSLLLAGGYDSAVNCGYGIQPQGPGNSVGRDLLGPRLCSARPGREWSLTLPQRHSGVKDGLCCEASSAPPRPVCPAILCLPTNSAFTIELLRDRCSLTYIRCRSTSYCRQSPQRTPASRLAQPRRRVSLVMHCGPHRDRRAVRGMREAWPSRSPRSLALFGPRARTPWERG
jgi:hypothetical protein